MSQLNTKLDVIGYFSTFIFRGMGFEIVKTDNDGQTYIAELYDKESEKTLYVTVTHIQDDEYVYTTSVKGEADSNISCGLNYDEYFKDVTLPITKEKLDSYYDDYKGDWSKTFPGAIIYRLCDFSHIEPKLEDGEDANPTARFFYGVVVPTFERYKENPADAQLSEKHQVQLVNEVKSKLCGLSVLGDDYEGIPDSIKSKLHTSKKVHKPEQKTDELNLPKFDDEYELLKNKPSNQPFSSVIPSIGDSDLHPLGQKYPSMKPYLDPLSDYNPGSTNSSGFNGMIPDRSHPLFSGGLNRPDFSNPGDHPRGARYDDPTLRDESAELGLPGGSFRGTPFGRSGPGFGGGRGSGSGSGPGGFGGFGGII